MKPQITIIIPVYNEGDNIEKAIRTIENKLIYSHEILVVYDFEEDNTLPIVKKIISSVPNIELIFNKKRGLINAIKTGIKKAGGEALVILSPDEADDPKTINNMYKKILDGYDVVCATRYSKKGKRINQNSLKLYLSKIAGITTPYLLGIPTQDITNGFKMYRKKVVETIPITTTGGWEFSMELTIKAFHKGYKITEVGTISNNRKKGRSKFKLMKWLPKYLTWYLYGINKRINRFFLIKEKH